MNPPLLADNEPDRTSPDLAETEESPVDLNWNSISGVHISVACVLGIAAGFLFAASTISIRRRRRRRRRNSDCASVRLFRFGYFFPNSKQQSV